MAITLEITVDSVEQYRDVLHFLKVAQARGELGCDFRARPGQDSIPAINEAELREESDIELNYRARLIGGSVFRENPDEASKDSVRLSLRLFLPVVSGCAVSDFQPDVVV